LKTAAIFLGLSAACLGAQAQAERLVSVYPLQSEQLDRPTRRQLETLLRLESERLPGVTVQSRGKTQRARKRASGEMRDCHQRLPCLVEVGELSGAAILILGTAGRDTYAFNLELSLVDIDKERILRSASGEVKGDAAGIEEGIRDLSAQLISPDEFVGSLDVRMLMPGARVIVDGLQVGTTPGGPFTGLKPGLREVEVLLSGVHDLKQMVRIRHGSITVIQVQVDGEQLRAEVDEAGAAGQAKPHAAAVALAQKLQQAAPTPGAAPAVATQHEVPAPAAATPELNSEATAAAEQPMPELLATAIAVAAAGAATSLIGAVGLGAWAFAYGQLSSSMASDGVGVRDPVLYNEWNQQRGLYEALGVAGGITLPVGLIALAGGVGLTWWSLNESETSANGRPAQNL